MMKLILLLACVAVVVKGQGEKPEKYYNITFQLEAGTVNLKLQPNKSPYPDVSNVFIIL